MVDLHTKMKRLIESEATPYIILAVTLITAMILLK